MYPVMQAKTVMTDKRLYAWINSFVLVISIPFNVLFTFATVFDRIPTEPSHALPLTLISLYFSFVTGNFLAEWALISRPHMPPKWYEALRFIAFSYYWISILRNPNMKVIWFAIGVMGIGVSISVFNYIMAVGIMASNKRKQPSQSSSSQP